MWSGVLGIGANAHDILTAYGPPVTREDALSRTSFSTLIQERNIYPGVGMTTTAVP